MTVRVLVLGGSGYIGERLVGALKATAWAQTLCAARRRGQTSRAVDCGSLDIRNLMAVTAALEGFDCVVNCVAGDADSIARGARNLAHAALRVQCRRIIHLSTMSVYGRAEGVVTEDAPLDPQLGWYGRAKCEAERHMARFVQQGGQGVVLRPGCVFGPGSDLWVGRIARWLRAGRVGDLGLAGDGWSNLVHVDDVCNAVLTAIQLPLKSGQLEAFNLAGPDSPRWNSYFVDLALAIKATPVRRISQRQLWLDSFLAGPPLKAVQKLFDLVDWQPSWLPDPLPPALVRFWSQEIQLDASAAVHRLGLTWRSYPAGVQDSANWLCGR